LIVQPAEHGIPSGDSEAYGAAVVPAPSFAKQTSLRVVQLKTNGEPFPAYPNAHRDIVNLESEVLKTLKLATLSLATRCGLSTLALNSQWRRDRLLILAYHGFSQDDEHVWNPAL
jgi:hypothetical protein